MKLAPADRGVLLDGTRSLARVFAIVGVGLLVSAQGTGGKRLGPAGLPPLRPTSLGIEVDQYVANERHLLFRAREFIQRADLTGDGDTIDWPVFHYDVRHQRLELVSDDVRQTAFEVPLVLDGDRAAFLATEADGDLNGDGDRADFVAQIADLASGVRTNLGLAVSFINFERFVLQDGVLALLVSELDPGSFGTCGQNADLNGDGDRGDDVLFLHDVARGTTINTHIAAASLFLGGGRLATTTSEAAQRADLNGDGDRNDFVVQLVDLATGAVQNLGLPGTVLALGSTRVLASINELQERAHDRNGDGDTNDDVLASYDIATASWTNHGLWAFASNQGKRYRDERTVLFYVAEAGQHADLNGDGDTNDFVLHLFDLAQGSVTSTGFGVVQGGSILSLPMLTGGRASFWVDEVAQRADLNGDGDAFDAVLHVRDVRSGATRNLGVTTSADDEPFSLASTRHIAAVATEQSQGQDLNGDGDLYDRVLYLYDAKLDTLTSLGVLGLDQGLYALSERVLVYSVHETPADLNGDGDIQDDVLLLRRLDTGTTYNLGVASFRPGVVAAADHLLVGVSESDQGNVDLNGNGFSDTIVHVLPLFGRGPF